jgi:hypothetical protein
MEMQRVPLSRAPAHLRRAFREGLPAAASTASRDTGNRISFAGLRAFAETRDFDLRPGWSEIARAMPSYSTRFRGTLIRVAQVGRGRQSLATRVARAGADGQKPQDHVRF